MDAKTFGAFLARMRKSQGLTQAELAQQLHVTDKAVSRWAFLWLAFHLLSVLCVYFSKNGTVHLYGVLYTHHGRRG